MRSSVLSVLLACSLSACVYDDVNVDTTEQNLDTGNGAVLNGKGLNGSGLGNALASVSFHWLTVNTREMHEVWLDGSELVGIRHNHIYRGTDFVGARSKGWSDTHHDVKLRVADVVAPATDNDVWHYAIEFRWAGSWLP